MKSKLVSCLWDCGTEKEDMLMIAVRQSSQSQMSARLDRTLRNPYRVFGRVQNVEIRYSERNVEISSSHQLRNFASASSSVYHLRRVVVFALCVSIRAEEWARRPLVYPLLGSQRRERKNVLLTSAVRLPNRECPRTLTGR